LRRRRTVSNFRKQNLTGVFRSKSLSNKTRRVIPMRPRRIQSPLEPLSIIQSNSMNTLWKEDTGDYTSIQTQALSGPKEQAMAETNSQDCSEQSPTDSGYGGSNDMYVSPRSTWSSFPTWANGEESIAGKDDKADSFFPYRRATDGLEHETHLDAASMSSSVYSSHESISDLEHEDSSASCMIPERPFVRSYDDQSEYDVQRCGKQHHESGAYPLYSWESSFGTESSVEVDAQASHRGIVRSMGNNNKLRLSSLPRDSNTDLDSAYNSTFHDWKRGAQRDPELISAFAQNCHQRPTAQRIIERNRVFSFKYGERDVIDVIVAEKEAKGRVIRRSIEDSIRS
jgi:hypothetical protein